MKPRTADIEDGERSIISGRPSAVPIGAEGSPRFAREGDGGDGRVIEGTAPVHIREK